MNHKKIESEISIEDKQCDIFLEGKSVSNNYGLINVGNHIFHWKCIRKHMEEAILRKKCSACSLCFASFDSKNIILLYFEDCKNKKEYRKIKVARKYVTHETEIVTRLPSSHSSLYEKGLNLQGMFCVMKRSSIYATLNKRQQKFLLHQYPFLELIK